MVISVRETKSLPTMELFDFCSQKYGVKFPPIVSMAYEEARSFKINGMLLVLWSCIRSYGYTSREFKENTDIFRLGGRYQKFRDAFTCGASELAKFDSTEQMAEQEEVEKLWAEAWEWVDKRTPPVVPPKPPEPPKPEVPNDPTPDVPKEPDEPKNAKQTDWKKNLKWLGGVASALLVVWGIVSMALPSWASLAGKAVLQLIASIFGG